MHRVELLDFGRKAGLIGDDDKVICDWPVNPQYKEIDMPLTKKGKKIKGAMEKEYGSKRGEKIFYASQNKGTIKGTHKGKKKRRAY